MSTAKLPVKAVLIDLSGTLHIEDTPITGAQEALKRLRVEGLAVRFVTNTTKEPLRDLYQRLKALDFHVAREEIFTSLMAARKLVEGRGIRPLMLLEQSAKEDFQGISEDRPNAVVVGLAPSVFSYEHINEAFRLLVEGAPLVAIHKGRYYKKKDGLLHIGPGPFVEALEYATGAKAEVVGKPQASFFHQAIGDLPGVTPTQTVMIGDDARDDVCGSQAADMRGILVKTGKYQEGDEEKIQPLAWAVCEHFPAAVDHILQYNGQHFT